MSWDVVVTTNAPESVVRHFVDVYRKIGAHAVHIFYDDPAKAALLNMPNVHEVICSPEYWRGKRPGNIERRQLGNARSAANSSCADWMLQCDIDEHLYPERPVQEVLNTLPEECGAAIVRTIEAVYLEAPENFSDMFFTPWFKSRKLGFSGSKSFWGARYGEMISISNAGFWAHRHGKPFVRLSAVRPEMRFPLHAYTGNLARQLHQQHANGLTLRHYDALPMPFWIEKHLSRLNGTVVASMMGDKREQLAQLIRETSKLGRGELQKLFKLMYCVDPGMLVSGLNRGAIITIPTFPPLAEGGFPDSVNGVHLS